MISNLISVGIIIFIPILVIKSLQKNDDQNMTARIVTGGRGNSVETTHGRTNYNTANPAVRAYTR